MQIASRRPRRWAVLASYAVVAGVSQMLWLNFAPLVTLIEARYRVSELQASLLVLVFPLLFVILSIPSGTMIDRRGYRFTVGLGALVMTAGACVRIFDGTFAALLAGQIVIAVAQPFVMNGISKLVADWFDEAQGAIATGLVTMGMFLGMAAGLSATPALEAAIGLRGAMIVFAVVTIAATAAFGALVHPNELARVDAPAEVSAVRFGPLLRDRRLLLLFALSLLGLGVFNGLTTWLERILAPHGIDAEQAGLVGGALLLGGIVGAVIIPALSDFSRRRRPYLLLCVVGALATIYPLCHEGRYGALLALGALHGFFFLPAYALLIEMCAQTAGASAAGAATSLLMLAGNAGGVLVAFAMPIVSGESRGFDGGINLMIALMVVGALLALLAPEPFATAPAAPGNFPATPLS